MKRLALLITVLLITLSSSAQKRNVLYSPSGDITGHTLSYSDGSIDFFNVNNIYYMTSSEVNIHGREYYKLKTREKTLTYLRVYDNDEGIFKVIDPFNDELLGFMTFMDDIINSMIFFNKKGKKIFLVYFPISDGKMKMKVFDNKYGKI